MKRESLWVGAPSDAGLDKSKYALGFEHGWSGGPELMKEDTSYVQGWQRGREHREREHAEMVDEGTRRESDEDQAEACGLYDMGG